MNGDKMEHDWFPLHGPSVIEKQDYYTLFVLFENAAQAVCTLYRGDTLLIGRIKKEYKHEETRIPENEVRK